MALIGHFAKDLIYIELTDIYNYKNLMIKKTDLILFSNCPRLVFVSYLVTYMSTAKKINTVHERNLYNFYDEKLPCHLSSQLTSDA